MRSTGSIMRTVTACLATGVVVLVASGSGVEPVRGELQDRIGTIEATLDGEQQTWYALEGTVAGQEGTSAMWMEMGDGTVNVIVGGYDRVDVPFDTFERDPETGMVVSYGDYEGDVFSVTFQVPQGATGPATLEVGEDDTSIFLVRSMDFESMLMSPDGRIHVETIDWEEGSFRGTFEGELRSRDGSETVRLTEGRFEVEGARPLEEMLPEGS